MDPCALISVYGYREQLRGALPQNGWSKNRLLCRMDDFGRYSPTRVSLLKRRRVGATPIERFVKHQGHDGDRS
eukprot:4301338-Pleurochrysis_carterae.AAC.1